MVQFKHQPGCNCCGCEVDTDFGGTGLPGFDILEPGFSYYDGGFSGQENNGVSAGFPDPPALILHKTLLPAEKTPSWPWQFYFRLYRSGGVAVGTPRFLLFTNDDGTGGYRLIADFVPMFDSDNGRALGTNLQAQVQGPDGTVLESVSWWSGNDSDGILYFVDLFWIDFRNDRLSFYLSLGGGDIPLQHRNQNMRGAYMLFETTVAGRGDRRWGFESNPTYNTNIAFTKHWSFRNEEMLEGGGSSLTCSRFGPLHSCDDHEQDRLVVTVSNAPSGMTHTEVPASGEPDRWNRWTWGDASGLNGTHVIEPDLLLKYRVDGGVLLGSYLFKYEENRLNTTSGVYETTTITERVYEVWLTTGNQPLFVVSGDYGDERASYADFKMVPQYHWASTLPAFFGAWSSYDSGNDFLTYGALAWSPAGATTLTNCVWEKAGTGSPTTDYERDEILPLDMATISWQFVPAP